MSEIQQVSNHGGNTENSISSSISHMEPTKTHSGNPNWRKGVSANPGGRKPNVWRRAIEAILEEDGDPSKKLKDIVLAHVSKAKNDVRSAEFLRDSHVGRPGPADEADGARIEVSIIGLPAELAAPRAREEQLSGACPAALPEAGDK